MMLTKWARLSALLLIISTLSGCSTLRSWWSTDEAETAIWGTSTSKPPTENTTPPATTPVAEPTAKPEPLAESDVPAILIDRATLKAVLDELVARRIKKGMKVKTRNAGQITMATILPAKPNKPKEEVRVKYEISHTKDPRVLIKARVLQVQNPDTFNEKVVELTRQLNDKIQAELRDSAGAVPGANPEKPTF